MHQNRSRGGFCISKYCEKRKISFFIDSGFSSIKTKNKFPNTKKIGQGISKDYIIQSTCHIFLGFQFLVRNKEKKWNSSRGNEEISRNLFTLKKHLIIAKSKVSIPKSTNIFVKLLTTKTIFIVFLCIKIFQIKFFFNFFSQFSSFTPKKVFI